ncbi:MAG: sigma-70 family RNA polymerase sigma factor [Rhodothermales bacterium]|nr:sigma-70 family RNA polymerase sigma factor [Rhodothermales bacterium]
MPDAPERPPRAEVTGLLHAYGQGDRAALDRLLPLVYDELHRLAAQRLRRERAGHTLGATALVHEVYLRLLDADGISWQDRAHFFALSASIMRRILIDHARRRNAQKRGGGAAHTLLDGHEIALDERAGELIALDEALERLEALDERLARVVEYRFFGGLTIEETAAVLDVSSMTIKRDFAKARAWLYRELRAS